MFGYIKRVRILVAHANMRKIMIGVFLRMNSRTARRTKSPTLKLGQVAFAVMRFRSASRWSPRRSYAFSPELFEDIRFLQCEISSSRVAPVIFVESELEWTRPWRGVETDSPVMIFIEVYPPRWEDFEWIQILWTMGKRERVNLGYEF